MSRSPARPQPAIWWPGNLIGTDAAGTKPMGNAGDGVEIIAGASNNTIGDITAGAGNTIAYNTNDGVQVEGNGTTGNSIRGNSIFANGVLGIELGTSGVPSTNVLGGSTTGPNEDQNYPVLTIVSYAPGIGTTIAGDINSTPNIPVFDRLLQRHRAGLWRLRSGPYLRWQRDRRHNQRR